MNREDREMGLLAKATLRTMPGRRKAEKGLPIDHTAMTIITYADGSHTDCWGHSKPLQVAAMMRKTNHLGQSATIQHVIRDRNGRGEIVSTVATLTYVEGKSGGNWDEAQ